MTTVRSPTGKVRKTIAKYWLFPVCRDEYKIVDHSIDILKKISFHIPRIFLFFRRNSSLHLLFARFFFFFIAAKEFAWRTMLIWYHLHLIVGSRNSTSYEDYVGVNVCVGGQRFISPLGRESSAIIDHAGLYSSSYVLYGTYFIIFIPKIALRCVTSSSSLLLLFPFHGIFFPFRFVRKLKKKKTKTKNKKQESVTVLIHRLRWPIFIVKNNTLIERYSRLWLPLDAERTHRADNDINQARNE